MSARNLLLAASVIATGFAGGLALAQPAQQPAPPHAQMQHAEQRTPGRFIEGRIAFLRTELKLSAQQQPLFDKLADEMRATTKTMQERHAQRQQASAQGPATTSVLERLEQRSAMMKEMNAAQDRYLAAFRPLYHSLSDEQKKTADQLFAKGGGMGDGMMDGRHGPRHH
ncbi:Spy/CpxP family protein refolding chaperone [Ferrovibrio terrae]|uniref:Spy/CpxP family protein refolding chaperone n=1 Tax=Ferrovibrio terrae TaxID=2594003 RepID=UPI003137FC05